MFPECPRGGVRLLLVYLLQAALKVMEMPNANDGSHFKRMRRRGEAKQPQAKRSKEAHQGQGRTSTSSTRTTAW